LSLDLTRGTDHKGGDWRTPVMAKVKSPNYPRSGLDEALVGIRKAFAKDNRNKMSQAALAKHLGHDSLSGSAFTKIGTLRAYGLIEGRGDELRISDDTVAALMAPEGSPERSVAIGVLAAKPKLYQEIRADFPTPPSPENLKFWLIKRKFAADAAETAAKAYLDTLRFVASGGVEYNSGSEPQPEKPPVTPQVHTPKPQTPPIAKLGQQHAAFPLPEGEISLSFPAEMSLASAQMMASFVKLLLEQAERQAKARESSPKDEAAN
jgi:hypothetical protein